MTGYTVLQAQLRYCTTKLVFCGEKRTKGVPSKVFSYPDGDVLQRAISPCAYQKVRVGITILKIGRFTSLFFIS